MQKIVLFYKFVPVHDTETVKFWQRSLGQKLDLKGRIIVSKHGINGTLGGDLKQLKYYTREMNEHSQFKGIVYKWSDGGSINFPKLSVKVRKELVAFDVADELRVDAGGVVGGGQHLSPEQLHKLLEKRGEEVIFYDGRNAYEASIGRFKNSVIADVKTTRDFKRDIEHGEIAKYKHRPIVTYCTGGIRCEILTSLMKNRGYEEVYQMDGGVVKYGEAYKDDGYWKGKLYVFDSRMATSFSDDAQDIGECVHCSTRTSHFINCANISCNKLCLVCNRCNGETTYCSSCHSAVSKNTRVS